MTEKKRTVVVRRAFALRDHPHKFHVTRMKSLRPVLQHRSVFRRCYSAGLIAQGKIDLKNGPDFQYFIQKSANKTATNGPAELYPIILPNQPLKFHIETYGCQMNVSDSEIVTSLLVKAGHTPCPELDEADLILTNTCAIRENAEAKVWHRLKFFQSIRNKRKKAKQVARYPIVGVLGCMAERLKERLLTEESVDFVCGPDAYRDIPRLLENVISVGQKQANTLLSFEETYADISPVREVSAHSAFVSIMRGCNNMCSFCIVPFTRGRERSRPISSILKEIQELSDKGVKEVVLLGQNVNGYHDTSEESAQRFPSTPYKIAPGFNNLFRSKKRDLPGARFADLLRAVAEINPEMRVRFTSPHPKDFPLEVLEVIADMPNICNSLHLPVQSGSSSMLERMRRGYSREAYMSLVTTARSIIPDLTLSTDIITGFCDETEAEHQDTLSLMDEVKYEQAFMFAYSLREKTHAAHTMKDNVPEDIKQRRLREVIEVYRRNVALKNAETESNQLRLVLVEGEATKSTPSHVMYTGRTDGNKRVVFPATDLPTFQSMLTRPELLKSPTMLDRASVQYVDKSELAGQHVLVRINKSDSSTLRGEMLCPISLNDYSQYKTFIQTHA